MSFDQDDEILQDFIIESGEILEQLSEQLVDLEQRPDDYDLLNAIFRGFHTVKGGGGFLQLDNLVALCHVAENVFDLLRNTKLKVNAELMDVVLQTLDTVNEMFEQVKAREDLTPAPEHIIKALDRLVKIGNGEIPADVPAQAEAEPPSEPPISDDQVVSAADQGISDDQVGNLLSAVKEDETAPPAAEASNDDEEDLFGLDDDAPAASSADDDDDDDDLFGMDDDAADGGAESGDDEVTEDELAALLGSIGAEKNESAAASESADDSAEVTPKESSTSSAGELITDDEFEALLDDLHGKAAGPTAAPSAAAATQDSAQAPAADSNAGLITDNEFDALLDELYGKGAGPTAAKAGAAPAAPAPAPSAPAAPKASTPAPVAKAAASKAPPTPAAAAKPKAPAAGKKATGKEAASATAETTVRVDTKRLDDIMNMVGELVLVRNRLVRLGLASSDENIQKAVANLDVVTADIQMSVMKTRMQPIKKVFGRFPRVVRDLARNLKKEINLELEGEDTDLDKNLVEALSDPLVHLVRNSVDHGIEMPSDREAAGKPRIGKILLSAEQEGDHIILSIRDDGGGMDPDMLRGKAVEKGMMDEEAAERLSDEEAFNLIFHPGFSTKAEISDVSGRGVGMDVVKTKIGQLNGSITIQSELDVGTLIAIKVPLTLAIMPTLMVKLGDQAFALPLVSVNEIFHLDLDRANVLDGQEVVIVRDKAVPLFYLKRWLVPGHKGNLVLDSAHVVVVTVGTTKVGLVVDQLIGQEEVVIKPLGKMLHGTPGMSGATITGDGSIAIILDVPSLIKQYT
ncbi:MAG: chemotaxis protein CheA [Gammaproteobacteria bacterium]|nr:chemotaxis protein CheA [Gammaproteobacteria bacterium]